jgi:hypothetical protein
MPTRNQAIDAYRGLVMLLMMGEVLEFARVSQAEPATSAAPAALPFIFIPSHGKSEAPTMALHKRFQLFSHSFQST